MSRDLVRSVVLVLLLLAGLASRNAEAQLSSEGTLGIANAYGTSDSADVSSTPGPGGLSVSMGGAATRSGGLNPLLWQDDWEWEAIVLGGGEVDYGFGSASLSLTASSKPQIVQPTEINNNDPISNNGNAYARGIVLLEFDDVVEVTSATLPPGTPVSIEFHFAIDSTDVSVGLNPNDSYIGSTFQGTVGSLSVGVFDLVRQVLGKQETSASFDTAVGHTLRIEGQLRASGEAHAGYRGGCCVYNTEVEATTTAKSAGLWASPPEGVELVAESGRDYTVPEPGAFAGDVAALLALATFMNSRRWFASGSRGDGPATSTARSHSMPCAARKRAA